MMICCPNNLSTVIRVSWRFGVVSLRRSPTGQGWWKEVGGKGRFFRRDGSCAIAVDHDAG